jgi:hypothetical protein
LETQGTLVMYEMEFQLLRKHDGKDNGKNQVEAKNADLLDWLLAIDAV